MLCNLCPRKCNSIRGEKNQKGFCRMPSEPIVALSTLHFGEEPVISGRNGSGAVFFSGCSLKCVFCQNYEVSRGIKGKKITVERLAEIFKELEQKGAHNINLVTPSHYAYAIKSALEIYRPNIPVIYNSSGYDSIFELDMLKNYIDIYLFDLKYLDSLRAQIYSGASDYPQVALNAIEFAYKLKGKPIIKDGLLKSGIIIRHLLMPAATNEAINVFDKVKEKFGNSIFSIMSQYSPQGEAYKYKEINRKITKREYEKVLNHIIDSNFENCFFQDLESAKSDMIPNFDLSGV